MSTSASGKILKSLPLLLLLFLPACNGTGPLPAASTSEPGPVQPGQTRAVDSSQPVEQNVTITFSAYEFYRDMFSPLIDEFQRQNPAITVQFVPIPTGGGGESQDEAAYFQSLAESADSTLVIGRSSAMGAYFLDLQPQIDADPAFDPADFWPGALTACQDTQGRVLGIPMSLYSSGIFYDPAAFETAGLAAPQPGWTWDDFRRDVSALATIENGVIRYGYADRSFLSILSPLVDASLVANNGQIDPQSLATDLQWYLDLARDGSLGPLQGLADPTQSQAAGDAWIAQFQQNRAPALWFGRLVEPVPGLAGVSEETDPATHLALNAFGLAPLPAAADGSNGNTTPLTAECAAISAGSTHPLAAWAWISFLSRHWLVADHNQAGELLKIPARQSVADSAGFWDNLPAQAAPAVRYGLEHAWYPGLYPQAENAVLAAVEKAGGGGITLASALAQAQAEQAAQPQDQPGRAEVVVSTPQATLNPQDPVTTIRFYDGSSPREEQAAFETLAGQFNQAHQGQIEVVLSNSYPNSSGDYYTALSGQYDCYLDSSNPAAAAASGAVRDLTALFAGEDAAFRLDFDPELIAAASSDGALYVLPFASDPPVLAYNADLLARRGIPLPQNGWGFDEFMQDVLAAGSNSPADLSYGALTASDAISMDLYFLAGSGVHWLDESDATPAAAFSNPQLSTALTRLAELHRSGVLYQGASGEDWWSSLSQAMTSGQVAFWASRAGKQSELFFDPGVTPGFSIGTVALPQLPTGSEPFYPPVNLRGFYISSQSENGPACWEWIKFLSAQPAATASLPARRSIAGSADWAASVGTENAAAYRQAMDQAGTPPDDPVRQYFTSQFESYLADALTAVENSAGADQALAEAQVQADAYRSCLLAANPESLGVLEIRTKAAECAQQAGPQD